MTDEEFESPPLLTSTEITETNPNQSEYEIKIFCATYIWNEVCK